MSADDHSVDLNIDEEIEVFLREFVHAWRQRTVDQKTLRAENERRMREIIRKNRSLQETEARKLTIAVTFNKWRNYLSLVYIERREERRLRAEANERLAKAKLKPTKRMLVRRESVLSSRRLSNGMENPFDRTGSGRNRSGSHRGSLMQVSEMAMEAATNRRKSEEIENERARFRKDSETKLEAYKVFRARQMKALSILRQEKLRLGISKSAPEYDIDNNRSAFPVPDLSAEELRKGQRVFLKAVYEHEHNTKTFGIAVPASPQFRPITQADVQYRFSPVQNKAKKPNSPIIFA
ncbi:hypothetical protein TrST_g12400 [Triparma strigata]|uniref:Uncharacterized protein n=1 Tax=Triparma strigata TaxID=1606541 RepID=A0A9W7E5H3_9STRA|nr:hypothetical protein TrST_g12400 [Triparma strigata]